MADHRLHGKILPFQVKFDAVTLYSLNGYKSLQKFVKMYALDKRQSQSLVAQPGVRLRSIMPGVLRRAHMRASERAGELLASP